jgi:hypothetical protein
MENEKDLTDIELEKMEAERMKILSEVFEKLSNERSYTTGEFLWDEKWLRERLFGGDK